MVKIFFSFLNNKKIKVCRYSIKSLIRAYREKLKELLECSFKINFSRRLDIMVLIKLYFIIKLGGSEEIRMKCVFLDY